MSFSGDFGKGWEHEKMAGWIRAHGGRYEREVTSETTHLICSIEDYKKRTGQGMFYFPPKIDGCDGRRAM